MSCITSEAWVAWKRQVCRATKHTRNGLPRIRRHLLNNQNCFPVTNASICTDVCNTLCRTSKKSELACIFLAEYRVNRASHLALHVHSLGAGRDNHFFLAQLSLQGPCLYTFQNQARSEALVKLKCALRRPQ